MKNIFMSWIRKHPWWAVGRGLWILMNFILFGSLFALLAACPFNGEIEVAILAGVTGGLLAAGLWAWQTRLVMIGHQKGAQHLGKGLGLAAIMILLPLIIVVAIEHYQLNPIGVSANNRVANFEQL
jgi:hypothetical protein